MCSCRYSAVCVGCHSERDLFPGQSFPRHHCLVGQGTTGEGLFGTSVPREWHSIYKPFLGGSTQSCVVAGPWATASLSPAPVLGGGGGVSHTADGDSGWLTAQLRLALPSNSPPLCLHLHSASGAGVEQLPLSPAPGSWLAELLRMTVSRSWPGVGWH